MNWMALVVLVLAAMVAASVVLILALRGRVRATDAELTTLRHDLRALVNAAVTVGERLNRTERQMKMLAERQEELGLRQEQLQTDDESEKAYDQAIKLASRGGSVEELVDVCGLSRGEAELIAMMHRLESAG